MKIMSSAFFNQTGLYGMNDTDMESFVWIYSRLIHDKLFLLAFVLKNRDYQLFPLGKWEM